MARASFPGRVDGINVPVRGQIYGSQVRRRGSIYRTLSAPRRSEKKRNTEKSHESHESGVQAPAQRRVRGGLWARGLQTVNLKICDNCNCKIIDRKPPKYRQTFAVGPRPQIDTGQLALGKSLGPFAFN
eukprot:3725319-Prymnesium_polylepis.1